MDLIIRYKEIDLKKATKWGLDLLLEMAIDSENYEIAAEVRDEIKRRTGKENAGTQK